MPYRSARRRIGSVAVFGGVNREPDVRAMTVGPIGLAADDDTAAAVGTTANIASIMPIAAISVALIIDL
jgi:hypothetical protein